MNEPPRPRPVMQSPPGPETIIDGRRYSYFAGTSYLGLHADPAVIEAACAATRRYGIHTATSRGGFGNNPPTLEVERLVAKFFAAPDAFYFVSGYMGTAVLAFAVQGAFDVILADEYCHFSMLEAAKLLGLPIHQFRHLDVNAFADALRTAAPPPQRPLLLTDGVFSSTGEIAPLDKYLQLLDSRPGAAVLIDDAHGVGTIGAHGRGSLEHLGLGSRPINATADELPAGTAGVYVCATLSKALGGFGGIVAGTSKCMDRVRTASHCFDAASAPPTAVAAASVQALEIVMARPELRTQLQRNIQHVRQGLRALGVPVDDLPTSIVAARCGSAERMKQLHDELRQRGFIVPYVRAYSGAGPEGLMRIAVCAAHTESMIDALLDEFRRLL